MNFIGLAGAARSGKDTVAAMLSHRYGCVRYALATPLKLAASAMFSIPIGYFYADDKKEKVINFWGLSPRQMVQRLGTEGGRQLFFDDIWLRHLGLINHEGSNVVVTDVRFDNEAEYIKNKGGKIIQIIRPNVGIESQHVSESGVSLNLISATIVNDSTLTALEKRVIEVYEAITN